MRAKRAELSVKDRSHGTLHSSRARINRPNLKGEVMKVKDLLNALKERGMDEEILIESEPDKYPERRLETVWCDERGIVLSARLMPD